MTQQSKGERFVEFLRGLDDRTALAALRRGLGMPPGHAPEMHRYVVRWASGDHPRWREDIYYIVAALFAYHPLHWPVEREGWSNLGASFAMLQGVGGASEQGVERRLTALLSAHVEDLHVHLRHAVSLLKANGVPIDWGQLLDDLRYWEHNDRPVQRNWARAFWQMAPQQPDDHNANA